ncbi:MAG: hypothetical protein ABW092_03010 [Candidatus Thiodiazotropha sp.]
MIRTISISILLFVASTAVNSAVVYSYTGNNYDQLEPSAFYFNDSMNLTGEVTFENALAPNLTNSSEAYNSYSFFNGRFTLDDTNSRLVRMELSTDSAGDIIGWDILAYQDSNHEQQSGFLLGGEFHTTTTGDVGIVSSLVYSAQLESAVANVPGVWSQRPVPIPAAAWLFISGFIGLLGLNYHKRGK